jgi:hypothetical protein
MTDHSMDKLTALTTVMRIADVRMLGDGESSHLSGPGLSVGPLIGEAFKRAINNTPEDYDRLLKAVEALLRPTGFHDGALTFDPETGGITGRAEIAYSLRLVKDDDGDRVEILCDGASIGELKVTNAHYNRGNESGTMRGEPVFSPGALHLSVPVRGAVMVETA